MVQTSISTQTKVLLVSAAALATGLAAYALGYYDYDWRLWQQGTPNVNQQGLGQQPGTSVPQAEQKPGDDKPVQPSTPPAGATLVSDPKLPDAIVGMPYQTVLEASTGPNTRWVLEQGALPAGLTLDEAFGKITGVATNPGPSLFRLKFGNNELSGVSQFTLNVVGGEGVTAATTPTGNEVKIVTDTIPAGRVGEGYSVQFKAQGDDETVRQWSMSSEVPGLTFGPADGKLSGVPTQAGTYTFFLTLRGKTNDQDRKAVDLTQKYTLSIGMADPVPTDPPLKITSNTQLPAGRVGVEYKYQLTATGGPANARYVWQNLDKIPGVTGNADGLLSGVPTQAGTYDLQMVSVTLKDTAGVGYATDFRIQILPKEETSVPDSNPGTVPFVITGGYPDGTIGNYYSSRPLEVTGGKAPFEWTVVSGNIPPGLSFSPNSQIGGYANQYGIFIFTVQVRDQDNRTVRAERTIHIRPSQPVVSASVDPDLSNRLRRIDLMGVQVHDLIKLQDDGNPDTQFDTTVYYIGADGRRHSFPNPKVYFSWFPDFSRVRIVASRELADIPLGANLTYRPGTKLVKFMTDPRVYAVDSDRRLRWVKTEAIAVSLYGPFWARQVDDISDAFYMDYRFGQDIERPGDYTTTGAMGTAVFPSDVLPR